MPVLGLQLMMLKDRIESEGMYEVLRQVRALDLDAVEVSQVAMTDELIDDLARGKEDFGVEIAAISPSPNAPEQAEPGEALCTMLTRHGVKAGVAVLPRILPRISEILNQRVTETGATMVVMGAYGHSRFREAILGGATRNMLEQAQVPVLMAR